MNIPLKEWINANIPEEKMLWRSHWLDQIIFFRDEIPRFLCEPDGKGYVTIKDNITVISTHISKSINLPVYCIKANDDKFILRNNFNDWKVLVKTHNIHNIDFQKFGVCNTSKRINNKYCEGFKAEWVYESYDQNKNEYTIKINDNFKLKLFFLLIQNKDKIWEK